MCACKLRRNAELRASALTGGTPPPPPPSSPRHHNKLIPTLLTSHPRQSFELGARQCRTRAQGKGCWATARLGRTVTRVLMEGLLGDGDGDVSRKDVSPRDVSLCRARSSRALSTERLRARLRQEQKQKATGVRQPRGLCCSRSTLDSAGLGKYKHRANKCAITVIIVNSNNAVRL